MAIVGSGVPTNRTNIALPAEVSSEIIAKTQEESAVMKLARPVALPGRGAEIPVIVSDPTAEWVSETGLKPVSNPTLDKKIMSAYKLATIVPFSNEFRRDASALFNALVGRLPLVLAQTFDATVFHGSAPGSNFDTFASVQAQALDTDVYAGLVAADADIADNGGITNGFVISPKGKSVLLGATDTTKRPLFINNVSEGAVPMILGAPTYQSKGAYKAGESTDVVGFAGDWTKALYGIVDGINVSYSEEATLTAGTAQSPVQINLFQQNMFAVRVEMEVGFRADTSVFNALTFTADSE